MKQRKALRRGLGGPSASDQASRRRRFQAAHSFTFVGGLMWCTTACGSTSVVAPDNEASGGTSGGTTSAGEPTGMAATGPSSASGGAAATSGGSGGTVATTSAGVGGTAQPSAGGPTTSGAGAGAEAGAAAVAGAGVGGAAAGSSGAGGMMAGAGAGAVSGGGGQAGQAGGSAGGAGGSAAGGGQGGSSPGDWWFDGPRPAPEMGSWPPPNIKLTEVSSGSQPTAIAAPRGDNSRLYFAEKWGVIRLIKDGALLQDPALDMRDSVLEGGPSGDGNEAPHQGKRGLVGLAFHPNFEENGRIFVLYTADQGVAGYGTTDHSNVYDDGDMTLAEYRRSANNPDQFDPEPVSVFLQFDKGDCNQCSQHNGGSLEVGVDGFLWASTGDPPPYDNPGSQDLNNLNGKILRFDISGDQVTAAGNYPGADPYVWDIGIRNTYKFSIDRYTGDLYVADVGENSWEELDVERYGEGNRDYGWPKREGTHNYQATSCGEDNCLEPVFDYGHTGAEGDPGADNCIIGGYVYRGQAIPDLQGTYIYGDYGSGKVRALQVQNGALVNGPFEFNGLSVFAGCFGEDAAGEMYVCDYNNNRILRVDAQ